jgi:hypothetical protein
MKSSAIGAAVFAMLVAAWPAGAATKFTFLITQNGSVISAALVIGVSREQGLIKGNPDPKTLIAP